MTRTEMDLRETLAGHVQEIPGNGDRLDQVHGRIRRAHRRRQAAASGVLALAVAGVAVGLTVPGHSPNASVVPAGPLLAGTYGTAALAGPGPVLLDATTGHTTTGHGGTALGLSHDGAYLASSVGGGTSIQVTDRAGRVLLTVPTGTASAAWSPAADVLAVVGTSSTATTTLYTVHGSDVQTTARAVTGGTGGDQQLAWSPDGRRLAVGSGHMLTLLTSTGTISATASFGEAEFPAPATWSGDGSHLVVFVHTGSASLDADGVRVVDLDAAGHQVGALPDSLAYPDWWHPLAGSAVLGTAGDVRSVDSGKTVVRCDLAAARCTTLAGGAETSVFGAVPTATGIAYISSRNTGNVVGNGSAPSSLWLSAADGSGAHRVNAPATVSQVVSSADGRTLLLVGSDVMVCPSGVPNDHPPCFGPPSIYRYDGHTPTRLAELPSAALPGYYGHVTEIVGWSQARG